MPIEDSANAGVGAEAYEIPGSHRDVRPFLIVRVRMAKTPSPREILAYDHFLSAFQMLEDALAIANSLRYTDPGRQS